MPRALLKKLVVEWRYKSDLAFYGKMDAAALTLAEDLPDWERSSLTVEVRDKKRHRRLFLSHNRAFFEVDGASQDADLPFVEKAIKKVFGTLGLSHFLRIGIRQWFAADCDQSFALMVDGVSSRFLNQDPELAAILTDKAEDVAFVVDYLAAEGWKYHLRMGPMTRNQWFEAVRHEPELFERSEDKSGETLKQYREFFPEQFLHLDIGCFSEDRPADRVAEFVTQVRRKTQDLASKLTDYSKRKPS